jgi:nucleoside-diphosphate kinase
MNNFLVIIKPGFLNYAGKIIERLVSDQTLIKCYKGKFTKEIAENFYSEHKGKPFYEKLIKYVCFSEVYFIEFSGNIEKARQTIGATDPAKAELHTIRAQIGRNNTENGVHCSDSPESAERELKMIFHDMKSALEL